MAWSLFNFTSSAAIALLIGLGVSTTVSAQENSAIRAQMSSLVVAYRDLQPYLANPELFRAPENEKRVKVLLKALGDNFHEVNEKASESLKRDTAFVAHVNIVRNLLRDATNRFQEGRHGYALVRLRALSQSCVSCHTRMSVPIDFSLDNSIVSGLAPEARAQYLAATRQFEKAESEFLKLVRANPGSPRAFQLLRQWLVLALRIRPNIPQVIAELETVSASDALPASDRETIRSWLDSLARWKNEEKQSGQSGVERSEQLIREGTHEELYGERGAVELVRATAMLHESLPNAKDTERARILRLLGEAYSRLTLYFPDELPEVFLAQCIREFPGSEEARRAYRRYEQVILLAYTGSGGTHLPGDVQVSLRELHDLAYSIPTLSDRI